MQSLLGSSSLSLRQTKKTNEPIPTDTSHFQLAGTSDWQLLYPPHPQPLQGDRYQGEKPPLLQSQTLKTEKTGQEENSIVMLLLTESVMVNGTRNKFPHLRSQIFVNGLLLSS